MSQSPRDPRQLARDILAGKISIEDLAREQQRRRAGQPPAAAPPANRPTPLPASRPPQNRQPLAPPVVRPATSFPQAKPLPQRPLAQPAPRRPAPAPARPLQRAPQQRQQPNIQAASLPTTPSTTPARSIAQPSRTPQPVPTSLSLLLTDRNSLRRGIILSEILAPPLAFREDF